VTRPAGGPPTVLVAVPAHDEAERIERCLASVEVALRHAERAGTIGSGAIAVAVHRSTDATAALARAQLAGRDRHLVTVTDEPASVGVVRTALVRDAVLATGVPTWVFSTDADTEVPPTWVSDGLRLADDASADLVLGLVSLTDLAPDDPTRRAHDALVAAGVHPDGSHEHAYAANLLVGYATFAAVGGFPDRRHGEEHGLLAAVRRAGGSVLSTSRLVVGTSGRLDGRAAYGLHTVLTSLSRADAADKKSLVEAPGRPVAEHGQPVEQSTTAVA
jgi:hypothetical protein